MASSQKSKSSANLGSGSGGQKKHTGSRLHPDAVRGDLLEIPKSDTQIQHSTNALTTGLPVKGTPVLKSSNDSQLHTVSTNTKPAGVPPPAPPASIPTPKPKPAPPSKPVSLPKPKQSQNSDTHSTTSTTPASKPATPAANPRPPPTSTGPSKTPPKSKFQRLKSSMNNIMKTKDKEPKAPSTPSNKSSKSPPVKTAGGAPRSNKTPSKKMFGNKSRVSPGKQKQGKRKKKKKGANKVNKDEEFIPSNVQHQNETFTNKPHTLLIRGIAKATTVHMTLTLGSQGEGRDHLVYNIYDEQKRRLCAAQEESKLKGGSRPFLLTFMNEDKEVAFTLERAKNFILCCFGVQCCGSVGTVSKGTSSEMIGRIKQLFTCGKLQYEIADDSGNTVMFVEGPNQRFCLRNYIGKETEFKVYVGSGTATSKELCGDMRVYSSPKTFTDDPFIFTVRFLSLIEPERKFIILAAGTLMYLSYYENNPGMCNLYGNFFWLLILIILVAVAVFVFVVAWILL